MAVNSTRDETKLFSVVSLCFSLSQLLLLLLITVQPLNLMQAAKYF